MKKLLLILLAVNLFGSDTNDLRYYMNEILVSEMFDKNSVYFEELAIKHIQKSLIEKTKHNVQKTQEGTYIIKTKTEDDLLRLIKRSFKNPRITLKCTSYETNLGNIVLDKFLIENYNGNSTTELVYDLMYPMINVKVVCIPELFYREIIIK